MPADTPAWQLFGWTYAGLNVPLILVESLGAACMSTFTARPDYQAAYEADGVGGLLRACLSPAGGFGDFCVVIVGLGIISNNVPNLYSFGASARRGGTDASQASLSKSSGNGPKRFPACSSRWSPRASPSCDEKSAHNC